MDKKDLQKQLEQAEKLVAEVREKLNKKPKGRFKPEIGQPYYFGYVDGTGGSWHWRGDEYDMQSYTMGNVYETEQEAVAYIAKIKKRVEVIDRLKEIQGDDVIDWSDNGQKKYSSYYNHCRDKWARDYRRWIHENFLPYYLTLNQANQACEYLNDNNIKPNLFEY